MIRRNFLGVLTGGTFSLHTGLKALTEQELAAMAALQPRTDPATLASDEDYWAEIG